MIDKLKFLIDESEDKPKLKKIFLKVAELDEDKQETMIGFLEILVQFEKTEIEELFSKLKESLKKT